MYLRLLLLLGAEHLHSRCTPLAGAHRLTAHLVARLEYGRAFTRQFAFRNGQWEPR